MIVIIIELMLDSGAIPVSSTVYPVCNPIQLFLLFFILKKKILK